MGIPTKANREFLEKNQYSDEGLKSYEFIFGENFVSSGGICSTNEILNDIHLDENSKVLDVGSGLGGGCKYICEKYGVCVYGVDISKRMVDIAKERNKGNEKMVFEAVDVLEKDFPDNYFDLIYSRDSILHFTLGDKKRLFEKCYQWLKPNGILLLTDYCACDPEKWDEEFAEYVNQRKYTLITINEYEELIKSCNFKNVIAKDMSDMWKETLEKELKNLEDKKEEFISKFSEKEYIYLHKGWSRKIRDSNRGIQIWGYIKAVKL